MLNNKIVKDNFKNNYLLNIIIWKKNFIEKL